MSALIQLFPGTWIAADDVRSIQPGQRGAVVLLKDGTIHNVDCAMISEIGPKCDELAARINLATAPARVNPDGYAVAPTARWHYPAAGGEPAPKGALVQLLTLGGTQVQGIWRDSGAYIAWAPNLKRDRALEQHHFNLNNKGSTE